LGRITDWWRNVLRHWIWLRRIRIRIRIINRMMKSRRNRIRARNIARLSCG
jgi:hypothetical protein